MNESNVPENEQKSEDCLIDAKLAPNLELEYLLKFRRQANNALEQITHIRHGANINSSEIWSACEHLESLITSINAVIKVNINGD